MSSVMVSSSSQSRQHHLGHTDAEPGFGPLLWSPLSEVPAIGRNPIYIATFAIFTILSVPTALVKNIGGLLVLRFLQG